MNAAYFWLPISAGKRSCWRPEAWSRARGCTGSISTNPGGVSTISSAFAGSVAMMMRRHTGRFSACKRFVRGMLGVRWTIDVPKKLRMRMHSRLAEIGCGPTSQSLFCRSSIYKVLPTYLPLYLISFLGTALQLDTLWYSGNNSLIFPLPLRLKLIIPTRVRLKIS